jgi:hypothetical protein
MRILLSRKLIKSAYMHPGYPPPASVYSHSLHAARDVTTLPFRPARHSRASSRSNRTSCATLQLPERRPVGNIQAWVSQAMGREELKTFAFDKGINSASLTNDENFLALAVGRDILIYDVATFAIIRPFGVPSRRLVIFSLRRRASYSIRVAICSSRTQRRLFEMNLSLSSGILIPVVNSTKSKGL